MDIHGLQKMTLLDYPGKVACTVFLAGCQFRCPFCHNSEILDRTRAEPVMDDRALLAFLETRKGLLEGVCFTGGEPLLSPGLPGLIREIRALGFPVKLDTNGYLPDLLAGLLDAGLLDYVAMDVKSSPERYAEAAGLPRVDLSKIERSLRMLIGGPVPYELRTTVVAELHDDEVFRAVGPWIRGASRYYLQAFADRDTVMYAGLHAPSREAMLRWAGLVRPYVGSVELRGI